VRNRKIETEIEAINNALAETKWNRKAAARLKVSYRRLLYKIQQHQMSPPKYLSRHLAGIGGETMGKGRQRIRQQVMMLKIGSPIARALQLGSQILEF